MNLQVRHPRARALARKVADRYNISLTDAVIKALEGEVARTERKESMEETLERLHAELLRNGKPGGHMMTKEEIDDMWGHPPDKLG